MEEKKLKDLKIGDKVWMYDFTDTTPITVVKKKREGNMMIVTLKWDDEEIECYGPALGWTCVTYNRRFGRERMFTSLYSKAFEREQRQRRISNFLANLKDFVEKNKELNKL